MARKPITQLAGGKSPRQILWENIRAKAGEFTLFDVCPGRIPTETARDYLSGLERAGFLLLLEKPDRGQKKRYLLDRDNGIEAPRVRRDGTEVVQGQGNEALWGAITVLDSFTAQEIAELAGATPATAKTYCMFLARAGYLKATHPGKGKGRGGEPTQFRAVKSRISGPRAPMITRMKAVYDPNLHKVVWMQGADDIAGEMDDA